MPRTKQEKKNAEVPGSENLPENNQPTSAYADSLPRIDVLNIVPSPFEPQVRRRAHFKQNELEKLSVSIFQNGLIQPVVVRPTKEKGKYELIAGERRWLAAKIAKLQTIPYLVRDVSDETAFEIQMQENLNRKDIDPLEEAYSFQYLIDHHNLTPIDVAAKFGRTESLVLRRLKLNDLIPQALKDVEEGYLPLGHAEEIAIYPPDAQKEILAKHAYKWDNKKDGYEPLDRMKKEILEYIVLHLPNAVFDKNATDLHPDGLACVDCQARTGFMPKLFDLKITKDDHCLNKSCFEQKVIAHFQRLKIQTSEKLIEKFPAFKDLSPQELEKKIPLVSDEWIYSGEKRKFGEGDYHEKVKIHDEVECLHSIPALVVNGKHVGKIALACWEDKCEVHKADVEESEPSEWQLKNKEKKFVIEINNAVREKVILKSIDNFDESNWFWNHDTLVDALLFKILGEYGFRTAIEPFIKNWENLPERFDSANQLRKFTESIDDTKRSQLLFLAIYGKEGYASWQIDKQDGVKKLAAEWTDLNYTLVTAQTCLELAPEEFKHLAQAYLDKIQNGEETPFPRFWWTAAAEAKFANQSSDEDEDEDGEDYEYDDDDDVLDEEEIDENNIGETTQA